MYSVDDTVRATLEILAEDGIPEPELSSEMLLLDTGLDSLGLAVLVTRLESTLGYDPFSLMRDAVYPRTIGEFVAVYEARVPPA